MKPEEKARQNIDKLLEAAGWTIQDFKDLNLATTLARELGVPLPLPNIALEVYQEAKAVGLSKKDNTVIITLFERYMGRKIADPPQPIGQK